MSTFSPVTLNKTSSDNVSGLVGSNGTLTPQRSISVDVPKQNLRGMNKPKCVKCGNIARSRCDFQSCKGCCSKARNPCLIHVLKQSSSTLPDKPPPSVAPLPEPISVMPSKVASTRLSSLRQLSSTYTNSLRAKRPLSRKDAVGLNNWRFGKLREYIEGNVRAEDEAFDRYIQNVGLLEEIFFVDKVADGNTPPLTEDMHERLSLAIKTKMQASVHGTQIFRHRIQVIVSRGLEKLQKMESEGYVEELHDDQESSREFKRRKNVLASRAERTASFSDLMDKLGKSRTDDDLKFCLETKQKLYGEEPIGMDQTAESELMLEMQDLSKPTEAILAYSLPKLCTSVKVGEDGFSDIEALYQSVDEIISL